MIELSSPENLNASDDENEALRARVAELERSERALREELRRAALLVEASTCLLYIFDIVERRNIFVNGALQRILGYSAEELQQMGNALLPTLIHPEDWPTVAAAMDRYAARDTDETLEVLYRMRSSQGETRWFLDRQRVIARDPDGRPRLGLGVVEDITDRRRAEEEQQRAAEQAQLIQAQADALRELGTPLIPIADGVIAMPLIGRIDQMRAQRILEVLLEGISTRAASVAILDITGVPHVDAAVADGLVRVTRAAGMLGAEVVLTGIGPDVARTLVELDGGFGGISTRGTFQSGIAHALSRVRRPPQARQS